MSKPKLPVVRAAKRQGNGMSNSPSDEKKSAASGGDVEKGEAEAPAISAAAQDLIGRKLRDTYASKLSEPVPDKFKHLLEQLSKKG